MPESRMNEVARELLRKSKDRKVSWEETSRRAYYRVVFPDVVLTISGNRTFGGIDPPYIKLDLVRLELMGDTGRVVDSLEATPEETMYPVLSQIFELAEQEIRDSGINKALEYLKRA